MLWWTVLMRLKARPHGDHRCLVTAPPAAYTPPGILNTQLPTTPPPPKPITPEANNTK